MYKTLLLCVGIFCALHLSAQRNISGVVKSNENQERLPLANIIVKGSTEGTTGTGSTVSSGTTGTSGSSTSEATTTNSGTGSSSSTAGSTATTSSSGNVSAERVIQPPKQHRSVDVNFLFKQSIVANEYHVSDLSPRPTLPTTTTITPS